MFRQVNQLIDVCTDLKRVRQDRLADLTLELLPVDGADVWLDLLLFFRVDPMLDAVEVDQANGSLACARHH